MASDYVFEYDPPPAQFFDRKFPEADAVARLAGWLCPNPVRQIALFFWAEQPRGKTGPVKGGQKRLPGRAK